MTRRVWILANPIAGGGRARARAPELAAALDALGHRVELHFSTRAGELREFAATATPDRCDVVTVVGGDGSLNEVLNGLPDPTLPIAQLPLGTANVLACELRLPRRPAAIAAAIHAGTTMPLAIGIADQRRFLMFVGAGLDGAMVERVEQVRNGPLGKWRWVAPVLHVVRRLPSHRVRIETADGAVRDGLSEALVVRVRNYGGVFRMPAGIRADDGLLHVVCFRQRTRWQWLRAAFAAWTTGLKDGVHCEVLRTTAVRIDAAEATPYHIDGDFGGRTPIAIRLHPERAHLVVAPASTL